MVSTYDRLYDTAQRARQRADAAIGDSNYMEAKFAINTIFDAATEFALVAEDFQQIATDFENILVEKGQL